MVTRVNFPDLPIVPAESGDTVAAYRNGRIARVPVVTPEGGTVTSVGVSMPDGFSVANSPVTTSGTIAVTFAAGYGLPTTTQMGQWSTAFGWGDHAQAGYALASAVTSALAGKVDTSDARLTNSREWTASTVSQAEAEAGTATTRRAWTAQRVRQNVVAWWNGSAEKAKLDSVQAGATANATDAQLRDRATHTGTQAISTVTGLSAALDAKVDKVAGYGLSQSDFTPAEKAKLAGLESSRFKGVFASVAALQSGVASPGAGDYADVDAPGQDVSRYIWDATDTAWVKQAGEVAPLTAAQIKSLYEANPDTNAFTDAEKSKLQGVAAGATANTGTVTSVQVAVPDGLQVAGGPVTTSGTLTISYQTGYSIPANNKQSQWDTAYGWGNHASAGYATTSALASGLAGKVDTTDARLSDAREWAASTVTQATAEAGTSTVRFAWTAQRVRQAIAAWWQTITLTKSDVGLGNVDNTADNQKTVKAFVVSDTRAVVSVPNDVPARSGLFEFKNNTSVGSPPSPSTGTYSHVLTVNGWTADGTGGWPTQISLGNDLAFRKGASATTWGPWRLLYHSGNAYSASEVDALISAATSGAWVWQATTTTLPKNTPSKVDFSSPRTLTLPASPAENDYVAILRTAGTTVGSTIARNGQTIMGVAENMTLDVNVSYLRLDFVNSSWRIAS